MTKETTNFERRMNAVCQLMNFGFGSLWTVGENIWKAKLRPQGYDENSNRVGHPGICVEENRAEVRESVYMLYGTSNKSEPAYALMNFYNEGAMEHHKTYFGHYQAVPIELKYVGRCMPQYASNDPELRDKLKCRQMNSVWQNRRRPQLTPTECSELKGFYRKYLARKGQCA